MSTPFYVSPEQLMKDRADFARKGIARGRSVVVLGSFFSGGRRALACCVVLPVLADVLREVSFG